MDDPSVGELAARLERLERGVWRWRAMALAGLGIAALMGAAQAVGVQEEIRAKSILLFDDEGRQRISIDGGRIPSLLVKDPRGRLQLAMVGHPERAAFYFVDADQKIRLQLANSEGGPFIGLEAPKDQRRLGLMIDGKGQPWIKIMDRDGELVWWATDRPANAPPGRRPD
jgi:hypothetical protein